MRYLWVVLYLLLLIPVGYVSAQEQDGSAAEPSPNSTHPFTPGYIGGIELGFLYGKLENPFGNPPSYLASPSVLIFNGYQFHRLFTVGLTTGFDFYEIALVTPIGVGVRGTFLRAKLSPYYSLDGGYGATFLSGKAFDRRPEGGWFFNPGLGLRVETGNQTAFLFGIGFKRQTVKSEMASGWGVTTRQSITYNRMSLRIGFMF